MEKEFLNIYSKFLLNKVKNKATKYIVEKDTVKEKQTDEKMIEVIKSLIIDIKESEIKKISNGFIANEIENQDFMKVLCMEYVALYNDNIELLKTLLDNNINLYGNYGENLIFLDRLITKKMNQDIYIELLKKQDKVVSSFLYSLKHKYDDFKNEDAVDRFSNLISKYPDICYDEKKENLYNFLTKESLKNFNDETLINASNIQKRIIALYFDGMSSEDDMAKLSNLIIKYNFSGRIQYIGKYFKYFNIEEIAFMTDEQINKINEIFSSHTYFTQKKMKRNLEKVKKQIKNK